MALKSDKCPNCGGTVNLANYICDFCGSYVISGEEKYADLSNVQHKVRKDGEDGAPGIYLFGRLVGKGERPLITGFANYVSGLVGAGGKLLLTDGGLYFSAHGLNVVGKKEASIPLREITDAKVVLNLMVSQHILITTTSEDYRFVVYHGQDWVEKIQAARRALGSAPEPGHTSATQQVKSNNSSEITVKCMNCGGVNTIRRGSVGECQFCGSIIKG